MRTFIVSVIAAVLIAAGAAVVLNNVPDTSARAFSTQAVRI